MLLFDIPKTFDPVKNTDQILQVLKRIILIRSNNVPVIPASYNIKTNRYGTRELHKP